MQINIQSNVKKIASGLDALQKRQLPFAMSSALNTTSVAVQNSIISAIPHIFNNRKKWWGKQQPTGIKVKFANKYELISAVYTRAYFANIQEEGGVKKPNKGINLAIPANNLPNKFRKSNALARERGNSNIFKSKSGKAILRRAGKRGVERLYTLAPRAHIKARCGFKKIAYKVFVRKFDNIFKKRLDYALKTAF